MKLFRRIIKYFLAILILFIVGINIPLDSIGYRLTETDYSNWMFETLSDDDLVVDVAMLGAHDVFSNEITIHSSVDPYESNFIFSGITGSLLKGYLVKQAKTQTANASELLNSGVRYLDIRLSIYEDEWFTKHNYLSGKFDTISNQITSFLAENPGEFLILDFQHINGIDYDSFEDYELFVEKLQDIGLLEYAYVVNELSTLTYGEVTNYGVESKIIILAPFTNAEEKVLNYDLNMRSMWADSDDFDYVIEFLENEAELALNDTAKFRVMQAVTTMQLSPSGILNSLTTWSLINRADQYNQYLVNNVEIEDLLATLPILMIDNAGSNKNGLHDDLMEIIINYNKQ